jgi:hypothetical protein
MNNQQSSFQGLAAAVSTSSLGGWRAGWPVKREGERARASLMWTTGLSVWITGKDCLRMALPQKPQ